MTCVADVGVSAESREGEAVSADDGMITQVAGSGQWAYRNEASEETAPVVAEETNSIVTRSMLCVPLLFQDTITGVLQLLNKATAHLTNGRCARAGTGRRRCCRSCHNHGQRLIQFCYEQI